jgi:hypothetical protein
MATDEPAKKAPADVVGPRLTKAASDTVDDGPASAAVWIPSVDYEASKSGIRAPPPTPVSCTFQLHREGRSDLL